MKILITALTALALTTTAATAHTIKHSETDAYKIGVCAAEFNFDILSEFLTDKERDFMLDRKIYIRNTYRNEYYDSHKIRSKGYVEGEGHRLHRKPTGKIVRDCYKLTARVAKELYEVTHK